MEERERSARRPRAVSLVPLSDGEELCMIEGCGDALVHDLISESGSYSSPEARLSVVNRARVPGPLSGNCLLRGMSISQARLRT